MLLSTDNHKSYQSNSKAITLSLVFSPEDGLDVSKTLINFSVQKIFFFFSFLEIGKHTSTTNYVCQKLNCNKLRTMCQLSKCQYAHSVRQAERAMVSPALPVHNVTSWSAVTQKSMRSSCQQSNTNITPCNMHVCKTKMSAFPNYSSQLSKI